MEQEAVVDDFTALAELLIQHAKGLELVETIPRSSAKVVKRQLHLYGKAAVSIAGRKPQPTYLAGVKQLEKHTGFYLMALYTHPGEFKLGPLLSKALKGKSCVHITQATPAVLAEARDALERSIALYRSLGWI